MTADHGNADDMLDARTASPQTAHSPNPCRSSSRVAASGSKAEGILADVVPTALALLGIDKPAAMTGRSLRPRVSAPRVRPAVR